MSSDECVVQVEAILAGAVPEATAVAPECAVIPMGGVNNC